ncbi:hypothetical protein HDU98_000414 [Podochytrium sp. JEL0797]|nr:hypothetical protein HDU98_000414 [Podochytrium sp. JEL0797]
MPAGSRSTLSSAPVDNTGAAGGVSASVNSMERMRKQLDDLRKMQMDLARKHLEIGSSSLDLSKQDMDPARIGTADHSNERTENIAKKQVEVHALMQSLQEMSDAIPQTLELNYSQSPSPVKVVKKSRKSATKKSGTSQEGLKGSKSSVPAASKLSMSSKRTKSMELEVEYLLTQHVGQPVDELRAIPKAGEANLSDTVKKRCTMNNVIDILSTQSSSSKPDSLGQYLVQKSANDERTRGIHDSLCQTPIE